MAGRQRRRSGILAVSGAQGTYVLSVQEFGASLREASANAHLLRGFSQRGSLLVEKSVETGILVRCPRQSAGHAGQSKQLVTHKN